MTEFRVERLDDVPLLIGFMQRLRLAETFDRFLPRHPLHQGLSSGQIALAWVACILSQADHAKYRVRDWANSLSHALSSLLGQPLRPTDFSDDRLSLLLARLADCDWHALESALWAATLEVHELPLRQVRLDSTTASGHHPVQQGGLMQHGNSKDHRPDLPQLKLMAAAVEPSGQMLALDVLPGNAADDPLYVPVIDRVRALTGASGLLYTGDSKMAALATRVHAASGGDFYLCRHPRSGHGAEKLDSWVDEALSGTIGSRLLLGAADGPGGERPQLGLGAEFERRLEAVTVAGKAFAWTERVQLFRPVDLHQRNCEQLDRRLARAQEELWRVAPAPGRGIKPVRAEETLREKVAAVLKRNKVEALVKVSWQRQDAPQASRSQPWWRLTQVSVDKEAVARAKERLGWQMQVTNVPAERLSLEECVERYRDGWCLEADWNLMKNRPLGLGPMWVSDEEQIVGLARLLSVALRVWTLVQLAGREGAGKETEAVKGTFPGQDGRKDNRPTTRRLLEVLCRAQVSLMVEEGEQRRRQVVQVPALLEKLLRWLGLPVDLYKRLERDAPQPCPSG